MEDKISNDIDLAVSQIKNCSRIVAFSGSGISAESGIPTFRDPGGLWDQLDPWEVGTVPGLLSALESKSDQLKPIFLNILDTFEKSEPNQAHIALSELEKVGKLIGIITQNIDNLHQDAGNTRVVEMHGNLFRMKCLSCGSEETYERQSFISKTRETMNQIPAFNIDNLLKLAARCSKCGELTRPDVVMFGEAVHQLRESYQLAQSADLMLVLGTSGVVYPAADLPGQAKARGAVVIEINPAENAFASMTDVYIPLKAGEALKEIMNRYGMT